MYVRLAFAVAAHLEPEILIVDEVLAVGDSEFQKKCLGKLDEVSKTRGRTILFVSHNMEAILRLCTKGFFFESSRLRATGDVKTIVSAYLHSRESSPRVVDLLAQERPVDIPRKAHLIKVTPSEGNWSIAFGQPLSLDLAIEAQSSVRTSRVGHFCESSRF